MSPIQKSACIAKATSDTHLEHFFLEPGRRESPKELGQKLEAKVGPNSTSDVTSSTFQYQLLCGLSVQTKKFRVLHNISTVFTKLLPPLSTAALDASTVPAMSMPCLCMQGLIP